MAFLETGGFSGSLVIFEHPAVMYRYSPALELYPMRDTRFKDFTALTLTFISLSRFSTKTLKRLCNPVCRLSPFPIPPTWQRSYRSAAANISTPTPIRGGASLFSTIITIPKKYPFPEAIPRLH
jgi:hypothetical protein